MSLNALVRLINRFLDAEFASRQRRDYDEQARLNEFARSNDQWVQHHGYRAGGFSPAAVQRYMAQEARSLPWDMCEQEGRVHHGGALAIAVQDLRDGRRTSHVTTQVRHGDGALEAA